MSFGKNFLAAVIAKKALSEMLHSGQIAHLFKGTEVALFDFVTKHAKKHGAVPEAATVLAHTGEELPTAGEPPSYYLDLMKKRHVELELKKSMLQAQDQLKALAPEDALATMSKACLDLTRQSYGTAIHDLRDAEDLLLGVYHAQMLGIKGLELGWPYLDAMTGGLLPDDLISSSAARRWASAPAWHARSHGGRIAEADRECPGRRRRRVGRRNSVESIWGLCSGHA